MAACVVSQTALDYYRHSPLSKLENIRLVRLLPHEDEIAPIRCKILEYPLQDLSRQSAHAYEALSYVWGSEDDRQTIYIHPLDKNGSSSTGSLHVTKNLHAALLHLRDRCFDRILWIDAICINQADDTEKGHQVQSMARIYASANRVIVWLGEATNADDGAISALCNAAASKPSDSSAHSSILALLERPWFQRIWVVQEIAAARQILIKCGHDEMDGLAFCAGLDASKPSYSKHALLRTLIPPITYLMRHVHSWPRSAPSTSSPFSLQIRPLPHLVDLYHTRNATKMIDKVYGLLGMCTGAPGTESQPFLADYGAHWRDVFRQLIRLSIPGTLHIDIRGEKESVAEIRVKGRIIGEVLSVNEDYARGDVRKISIEWRKQGRRKLGIASSVSLQASAKPVEAGDVICLLGEAWEPTIIRLFSSYAIIIMIQPPFSSANSEWSVLRQRITPPFADFTLMWDWGARQNEQAQKNCCKLQSSFVESNGSGSQRADPMLLQQHEWVRNNLDESVRLFRHGMLLNGMSRYEESANLIQEAIRTYRMATQNMGTNVHVAQDDEYGKSLRIINDLAISGYESREVLHWAADHGHEIVAELLLGAGQDTEALDNEGRTALFCASEHGHVAMVKLLLSRAAYIEAKPLYSSGQTPLLRAANMGHEAVVKMLLDNGADINARDDRSRTALLHASAGGHITMVGFLLERGADIEANDKMKQTALLCASSRGDNDMVKLLLDKGANIEAEGEYNHTALTSASMKGHEVVVKLLLQRGARVNGLFHGYRANDPDEPPRDFRRLYPTALLCAARGGHAAVVRLLLDGGANIEARGGDDMTALSLAWEGAHEAVAKLLLDRGATFRAKDWRYWKTTVPYSLRTGHASTNQSE